MKNNKKLFGKVNWSTVNHFSPNENWGEIEQVAPLLIYALNDYRESIRNKLYLSPREGAVFATKGHATTSLHYSIPNIRPCVAADVYPDCDLVTAWITALKWPVFNGIGIYPYWRWEGHPELRGGLHLDLGDLNKLNRRRLWWVNENQKYYYLNTFDGIKELFQKLIYFT